MVSIDYVFPVGSGEGSMQCINVSIIDDALLEGNETFIIELMASDVDVLTPANITIVTITSVDGNNYDHNIMH